MRSSRHQKRCQKPNFGGEYAAPGQRARPRTAQWIPLIFPLPGLRPTSPLAEANTPGEQLQGRGLLDDAIKTGIDVVEADMAEFDLTPGLIRKTSFQTRLTAGFFKSETTILITRLVPK